jgi:signal transduction histidine kinase/ligand-binding sensor domain-containing protein
MRPLRHEVVTGLTQALLVCIYAFLVCVPASGLDRDRTITQFYHSAWTAKDGAPSQVDALAQTADGYLWVGSSRGLFRFDGVRFERYEPPAGVTLPSHNINSLMAMPDGGLWISFNPSGVGFLKDGQLHLFSPAEGLPPSEVYCFARDLDGRIWGGTHHGLVLLDGPRWIDVATQWNFTNQRIWTMFVDRDGTLWVATDSTVVFLPRGSKVFQQTGIPLTGVPQIAQAKDGRLWISEWPEPVRQSIRPLPVAGRDSVRDDPEIRVDAVKFLFDREGSLWMTGSPTGVIRLRFPERLGNRKLKPDDPELEFFSERHGLTDNATSNVFEDREGNIWIGSNKGLDRFRRSHLVPVSLPPGHRDFALLAGDKGDVWVGSAALKPLLRIHGEDIIPESIPMQISSVTRGANDVVWWGGHGGIWRQANDRRAGDRFDFFPQWRGTFDWLWEVMTDPADSGLWIGLGDLGLVHFKDGAWTDHGKPGGLLDRTPSASYQDPARRLWLGYTENRVYLLDGDRVQAYSQAEGIDIGRIRVIRGGGPHFWFGGELGLAIFRDGRFSRVGTVGQPFGTVSGIVETADGALWLNELHGVVHISAAEVRQLVADPNHAVIYQTFDFLDGLRGAPQMNFRSSTAIEATDGRLWFATDNGLVWIDPAHISQNALPPPISIRSITADEKTYSVFAPVKLPALTKNLRIDYTALSLSIPERVRFRYKLEGADENWQEADSRRQAFYTNLAPGKYSFHVIACNNDGVWNEQGAALGFIVAPAWYQTIWFRVLCVVLGLSLVLALYRLRVQQVAKGIGARFDERLGERTRLARELHDTLLQTIQGSKLVADDALEGESDLVHMRRAMERLSSWLGQATQEGRAALNSLRSSITEQNDLTQAFQQAIDGCLVPPTMSVNLSVRGNPRVMHPIVRDEFYRIGYEAIHNACMHSQASRVEVELKYADDLSLRVSDNGVGIDPIVAEKGKEGHYGLQGMRERTARIGGKLTIVSSPTAGAEILLVVPGGIVFRKPNAIRFEKIKTILRS